MKEHILKQLKESEEKYRYLFDTAPFAIILTDLKGIIFDINKAGENLFIKYRKRDIVGKRVLFLLNIIDDSENYLPRLKQRIKILLSGDKPPPVEYFIKREDQSSIWVKVTNSLVQIDKKPYVQNIIQDITQQKESEQKLKESEENYRLIFENANDLISMFNHRFKYIYINERPHIEVLGYSKADLIGKSPLRMIHRDDFNTLFETFQEKPDLSSRTKAFRIKHKNGSWLWLEFRGSVIQDDTTGMEKYMLISRDVTTQHVALDELKKKEELLRTFIEESHDGVVLIDEKGIITHWNRSQEKIFGLKKKEVLGRPVWDIMFQIVPDNKRTVDMYTQTKNTILKSLKTGKGDWLNKLTEVEFQDLFGTHKFVQQSPFPIKVAGGYIFGSICRDITKMKISEERLKASEEQFRKAYYHANFYKELFAHDLANILSIISGSSQLCSFYLNEIANGIHLKENIELIKDQVIRAKNLINNVRKLSMIEESTPLTKKIDLILLLKESVVFISRSYKERDISIKIESSPSKILIQANELLSDVFDNILINAITYNENPTVKIIIHLSEEMKEGRDFLKLEFVDNGIGIPDNRKKKIFEERQEKEDFVKGMGIGLTLVKTIINSYNGSIWVENAVQDDYTKGSNFILLIPENP